jgi:hypothetical protein
MHCSMVRTSRPDRRPNVLAAIDNARYQAAGRTLTTWAIPRKALPVNWLRGAGGYRLGQVVTIHGFFDADCRLALESWLSNLVSYKWLAQVLCSVR